MQKRAKGAQTLLYTKVNMGFLKRPHPMGTMTGWLRNGILSLLMSLSASPPPPISTVSEGRGLCPGTSPHRGTEGKRHVRSSSWMLSSSLAWARKWVRQWVSPTALLPLRVYSRSRCRLSPFPLKHMCGLEEGQVQPAEDSQVPPSHYSLGSQSHPLGTSLHPIPYPLGEENEEARRGKNTPWSGAPGQEEVEIRSESRPNFQDCVPTPGCISTLWLTSESYFLPRDTYKVTCVSLDLKQKVNSVHLTSLFHQ